MVLHGELSDSTQQSKASLRKKSITMFTFLSFSPCLVNLVFATSLFTAAASLKDVTVTDSHYSCLHVSIYSSSNPLSPLYCPSVCLVHLVLSICISFIYSVLSVFHDIFLSAVCIFFQFFHSVVCFLAQFPPCCLSGKSMFRFHHII